MRIADSRRFSPRLVMFFAMLGLVSPTWACTVSASPFQFGTIDPLVAVDTVSTSDIHVSCTSLTNYSVALSSGAGSYAERLMVSGSQVLVYNLYSNPTHTTIWGDGTGGTVTVSGSASIVGTTHTIYGRLPHQPRAVPGVYSDSIVVTIAF